MGQSANFDGSLLFTQLKYLDTEEVTECAIIIGGDILKHAANQRTLVNT